MKVVDYSVAAFLAQGKKVAVYKFDAEHLPEPKPTLTPQEEIKKLKAALVDARASFLGLQPDEPGPMARQMGKAIERINKALE